MLGWWWLDGGGGRNAEEALYCPPSNYARIIKVESHREYWRAVHSNCSLGIYTCGTPWIARGPFRISTLPLFSSGPPSLCCPHSYTCFLRQQHPRLLAVSPPFTPRKQWGCPFSVLGPFPSRAFRSSAANFLRIDPRTSCTSLAPFIVHGTCGVSLLSRCS